MPNKFDYAQVLTPELDKLFVHKSVTGFLIDEGLKAKFVGAKSVLIPDMTLSGLGNYSRTGGFTDGSVTVTHRPYELTMDRGQKFLIDEHDADESGVPGLAGKVSGEFVRTQVVPEVDAYGLSKMAKVATDNNQTIALSTGGTHVDSALKLLQYGIDAVQDVVGDGEELIAYMNRDFTSALNATPELERRIDVSNFKKGELNYKIKSLDGVGLIKVPTARMKTQYEFNSGEDKFGFTPTAGAQNIGLIVLPKSAVKLVKKTDKVRYFSPEQVQSSRSHQIDYRIYYDFLIKNSAVGSIFAYTY